jgi:hypothetical protein
MSRAFLLAIVLPYFQELPPLRSLLEIAWELLIPVGTPEEGLFPARYTIGTSLIAAIAERSRDIPNEFYQLICRFSHLSLNGDSYRAIGRLIFAGSKVSVEVVEQWAQNLLSNIQEWSRMQPDNNETLVNELDGTYRGLLECGQRMFETVIAPIDSNLLERVLNAIVRFHCDEYMVQIFEFMSSILQYGQRISVAFVCKIARNLSEFWEIADSDIVFGSDFGKAFLRYFAMMISNEWMVEESLLFVILESCLAEQRMTFDRFSIWEDPDALTIVTLVCRCIQFFTRTVPELTERLHFLIQTVQQFVSEDLKTLLVIEIMFTMLYNGLIMSDEQVGQLLVLIHESGIVATAYHRKLVVETFTRCGDRYPEFGEMMKEIVNELSQEPNYQIVEGLKGIEEIELYEGIYSPIDLVKFPGADLCVGKLK